jgi:hypothetical protein
MAVAGAVALAATEAAAATLRISEEKLRAAAA